MCPTCRHHLVEIAVHLGDVTVTMHACSSCERRWWDRDGETPDLGAVLAMAADGV
jgi:Zn-finger nucleic acid-binding protein